jgi:hypothetical protein
MKKGLVASASPACRERLKKERKQLSGRRHEDIAKCITDGDLDALFHGLEDRHRGALTFGFGELASLFEHQGIDASHFANEYGQGPAEQGSAQELVESILQRL